MYMAEVTFDSIEKAVRELAAENPDFEYDKGSHAVCQYNPDEAQPGCLFGQAFIRIGRKLPDSASGGINSVLSSFGIEASPKQRDWAGEVQGRQDRGVSWAKAVKDADVAVEGAYGL
jgi:hypothetical protein